MAMARLSSSACPVTVGRFVWQSVHARRPAPGIHAGLHSAPFVRHRGNESLPVIRVSGQRIAARPLAVARRSSRLVSAVFVGRSCCRLFPEHSRILSIPSPAPRLSVCLLHYLLSHSFHIVIVLVRLALLFFNFPFCAWTRSFSHTGEVC